MTLVLPTSSTLLIITLLFITLLIINYYLINSTLFLKVE